MLIRLKEDDFLQFAHWIPVLEKFRKILEMFKNIF